MALKTGGKPFPDDLERQVRTEAKEMKREAAARAAANKRPSEQPRHKKLRQRDEIVADLKGRVLTSDHAVGRVGKQANAQTARRRKNAAVRKSRRANRG